MAVGMARVTVLQDVRPGAGFKTGEFVKTMLGRGYRRTTHIRIYIYRFKIYFRFFLLFPGIPLSCVEVCLFVKPRDTGLQIVHTLGALISAAQTRLGNARTGTLCLFRLF